MKDFLKKILPSKAFASIRDVFYPEKIYILEERLANLFVAHYDNLLAPDFDQKTAFKNAEFKVYSKHGGDGILAHIFSKVGVTNRTFVEMGVEDGRECNTANLSRNFGWNGLMIDANENWVRSAEDFYRDYRVKVAHSFVTAENINQTILQNNLKGEIDLLSIDIDGNDYWVWKAINAVSPRIVVLEYNSSFGQRSVTQKYMPDHRFSPREENPLFFGASLKALAKLSKEKGYILVACDVHGHDAFFIRADVAAGQFKEQEPEETFYPNPHTLEKFGTLDDQFNQIKHLDFVEI
ncbi:MAG: hypothetical protein EXS69_02235 [Candidatus Zambryskibacteria bacterium]|nr:hypothetical protein [Candidatus Zambryskibacteria bacterium]